MSVSSSRLPYREFAKSAASIHAALIAVSKSIGDSGLDKGLVELVKLRASQINGCAFCLELHLGLARQAGVAPVKLDLLAAWRESGVFSEREGAALAWTEALTRLGPTAASDADYAALRSQFDEGEALFLTVAIGLINQWNRIAVGLRFAPPAAA
jgi:AhpD family alkylhydroperoxidase